MSHLCRRPAMRKKEREERREERGEVYNKTEYYLVVSMQYHFQPE